MRQTGVSSTGRVVPADNQIARVHFVNAAAHKATLCHTGQKTDQDCGGREGLFLAGRGYGAGQALALHAEQCVILPEQGDLTGKKGVPSQFW